MKTLLILTILESNGSRLSVNIVHTGVSYNEPLLQLLRPLKRAFCKKHFQSKTLCCRFWQLFWREKTCNIIYEMSKVKANLEVFQKKSSFPAGGFWVRAWMTSESDLYSPFSIFSQNILDLPTPHSDIDLIYAFQTQVSFLENICPLVHFSDVQFSPILLVML